MRFEPIERLEEVASTNDYLLELARQGAATGTTVVAQRQTRGKGRLGRAWHSPEGGLWVSTLLRPENPAGVTLMGALASCLTLESLGFEPKIRWPNDLTLEGRKVAGVLGETRLSGARCEFVVLGLGLNIHQTEFTNELKSLATSLAQHSSQPPQRETVLEGYLHQLSQLVNRSVEQLVEECRPRLELVGRRVTLELGEEKLEGTFQGLDPDGGLILEGGRTFYSVDRLRPA